MKRITICFFVLSILISFSSCEESGMANLNSSETSQESSVISDEQSTSESSLVESDISNEQNPSEISKNESSKSAASSSVINIESADSSKSFSADSQDDSNARATGNEAYHIYRNANDMGSCRFLNGNVYVYCFFVDDDESNWTKEQSDDFLTQQINPALDFLVSQAKTWDVDLSFCVKTFCNETEQFSLKYSGTVNKDLTNGGSTKDIFMQIAYNMGYSSDNDYSVQQDKINKNFDTIYLTIINKKGRSYTRNLYSPEKVYYLDNEIAEHCVIFSKDLDSYSTTNYPKERSATIAHEILHLFGGEDYYGYKRLPLANQHYFLDIMTLNSYNIDQLKIMDMTAFSIGWINTVPELCYNQTWIEGRFP